jgi:plastocyanin
MHCQRAPERASPQDWVEPAGQNAKSVGCAMQSRRTPASLLQLPRIGGGDFRPNERHGTVSRRGSHHLMGVRWSAIALGVSLSASASAADHVVTALSNLTFSPNNLTIAAGDTVTFRNGGGLHNVTSAPGAVTLFVVPTVAMVPAETATQAARPGRRPCPFPLREWSAFTARYMALPA